MRLLILEDDALLAMDLVDQLEQFGYGESDIATSVQMALRLLNERNPDAAVLDINLGRETSEPVAEKLRAIGVPFVVVSAYSSFQSDAYDGAMILSKPVNIHKLVGELERMKTG